MDIPPLWYRIFYAPASPAGPVARSEALELFDYYRTGAPNTLYEALSFEIYRAALNSDTAAFVHLAAWLDAVYDHFADTPAVQAAWALARGEVPDFPLQNIRERHGRPALWIATFGAFENAVVASPETVRALVRAGAEPLERFVVPGEEAAGFVSVLAELEAAGRTYPFFADLAAAARGELLAQSGRVAV